MKPDRIRPTWTVGLHGMPMFQRFSNLPWLRVILFFAFALRAGAAVIVQKQVDQTGSLCLIAGDAEGYWMLARHLSRGEDFAIYDPPRYVERMPGFPLLLAAGIKLFGGNVLGVRLLLAAVGTAACGLVYWLGQELVDRTTGLAACFLAAVSPTFVVFSVLLLSETLFAATLLASLLALAALVRPGQSAGGWAVPTSPAERGGHSPPYGPWTKSNQTVLAIVAGVLCGAATLVRPTWILVGPAFVVLYAVQWRLSARRLVHGGLLLLGLSVVLAPWMIRNYLVTGHFVATTLWVGPSLYDGLSPQATGDSNMDFVENDGRYARSDVPDFEFQANTYYRRAALGFARRNPRRAIALGCHKLWRFANPFPNAEQFSRRAVWWGTGLFETPVLVLAAVGAWRCVRQISQAYRAVADLAKDRGATGDRNSGKSHSSQRPNSGESRYAPTISPHALRFRDAIWALVLSTGPILYFALVHTVFVGSIRYRLPAEYALLVVTAVGLSWLMERRVRSTP